MPCFPLPSSFQVVRIPQGQTDAQLRELLAPYKDVQLLHFNTLHKAFGGWEDKAMVGKFQVSSSTACSAAPTSPACTPLGRLAGMLALLCAALLLQSAALAAEAWLPSAALAPPALQHRLSHMMGFFCCKKVKEGEDGGAVARLGAGPVFSVGDLRGPGKLGCALGLPPHCCLCVRCHLLCGPWRAGYAYYRFLEDPKT